jgi:hypothetical protein
MLVVMITSITDGPIEGMEYTLHLLFKSTIRRLCEMLNEIEVNEKFVSGLNRTF